MMLFGSEILTTAQMRAIESDAIDSSAATGLQLMERAGTLAAGHIRLANPKPGRAVILCGPGNNGGDGYVVARQLHHAGWSVRVLGLDNMPGPDAAHMKALWQELGPIHPLSDEQLHGEAPADIYVDAIFGTGLTRPADHRIMAILKRLGSDDPRYRDKLYAIDCVSGLCLDCGAMLGWPDDQLSRVPHARMTIAFDSPKPGHLLRPGCLLSGQVVIADIGISAQRQAAATQRQPLHAIRRSGDAAPGLTRLLSKSPEGHKYRHGHAIIVAGAAGHGGAARLSARAALRLGAGLVTLCPPQPAMPEHAGPPDALMRRPIDDGVALADLLTDGRISSICIGPGCGISRAAELLPTALQTRLPCILDADALSAIARDDSLLAQLHDRCVLTPHEGEFSRLFPDIAARLHKAEHQAGKTCHSRIDAARDASARSGAVVLLKGPDTVIAAPTGECCIHSALDVPWLATAGSGDVLAGMAAGLLARAIPPFHAAGLAALLHAEAARQFGPGLIADDLPEQIPSVLRALGV